MLSAITLGSASLSIVFTLPTSQEPVNDTVATFGSSQKSFPIPAAFGLLHDTTFSTPLGIPAWWASYKQIQRIIPRLRSADPEQYTIIMNSKNVSKPYQQQSTPNFELICYFKSNPYVEMHFYESNQVIVVVAYYPLASIHVNVK